MAPKNAAYGLWESPIEADDFGAADSTMLDSVHVNRSNGKIYLCEIRPGEEGRGAIVEFDRDGTSREVLPKEYSALSQVHEYGGGSFIVRQNGHLVFTDMSTKGVFDFDVESGVVAPLLEADPKVYYADFDAHDEWILAIKEDHHPPTIGETTNTLVAIDSDTKTMHTLSLDGTPDFVLYPRFSPDGKKVCWIQFSFPSMPWDYTELWLADFKDGQIANAKPVAGKEHKASVTQPVWSPDGSLFFVDDRSGWWQLYKQNLEGDVEHIALPGLEESEFGNCDWWLGCKRYTPLGDKGDKLFSIYLKDGYCHSILIDLSQHPFTSKNLDCPVVEVMFNAVTPVSDTHIAIIGATLTKPQSLFLVEMDNAGAPQTLKSSSPLALPEAYAPTPRSITFPCSQETGGGFAHAIYFPPTNPNFTCEGPAPLIVAMHGGPTWVETGAVSLRDAFLYTRGYAVVQINYRGSAGYGKRYAALLKENWGVRDIADAVSCVGYLAKEGLIDKSRVGLTGHSAGGYATMQGLARYPDVWTCGVAESGIADLSLMLADTHKFESHYLDLLLWQDGASKDQIQEAVKERSPITYASNTKAPMLIIGGKDDPICPPNQCEALQAKLQEAGVPVDMVLYPNEGHVYSRSDTLIDVEKRREAWFRKYLVKE